MGHDVFISHAAEDKAIADAVTDTLEQGGVGCWIAPRDIRAGDTWGGSIVKAIEVSKVMIIIFSSKSNSSHQVMREVERAVQKNVVVLPFRVENIEPSDDMEYFLSATHWLDAVTPDMDKHLEDLLDTAKSILERPGLIRESTSTAPDLRFTEPELEISASELSSSEINNNEINNGGDTLSDPEVLDAVALDSDEIEATTTVESYSQPAHVPNNQEKINLKLNDDLTRVSKRSTAQSGGGGKTLVWLLLLSGLAGGGWYYKDQIIDIKNELTAKTNKNGSSTAINTTKKSPIEPTRSSANDIKKQPKDSSGGTGQAALEAAKNKLPIAEEGPVKQQIEAKQEREIATEKLRTEKARITAAEIAAEKQQQAADVAEKQRLQELVAKQEAQKDAERMAEIERARLDSEARVRQETEKLIALEQERITTAATSAELEKSLVAQQDPVELNTDGGGKTQVNDQVENQKVSYWSADELYKLGLKYDTGDGVPEDDTEAVKWYRKAADQGSADAQNSLATMFEKGLGVPRSEVDALRWYRIAADNGHIKAQISLGVFYEFGIGVPKNDAQALNWYRLAAEKGDLNAIKYLGDLEEKLSKEQHNGASQ